MNKKKAALLPIAFGFFIISGQVLLLREVMQLSLDRELAAVVSLALFLLWTALGSLLAARFLVGRSWSRGMLLACVVSSAVLLPLTLVGLSLIRPLTGVSVFQGLEFSSASLFTALVLGPLCIMGGCFFPLALDVFGRQWPEKNRVSALYMLESAGSGLGTLFLTFYLFPAIPSFRLVFFLSAMLFGIACFSFVPVKKGKKPGRILPVFLFTLFGLSVYCAVSPGPYGLYKWFQWKGAVFFSETGSKNGPVEAVGVGHLGTSLFENKALVHDASFGHGAEYLAELALVQKPDIRDVLVLGGSLKGFPQAFGKKTSLRVDYVESNPVLLDAFDRYVKGPFQRDRDNTGLFVRQSSYDVSGLGRRYDLVLLNSPEEVDLSSNRLFSAEYFADLKTVLKPGGLVLFQVDSSKYYLNDYQLLLLACIKKTLGRTFESVLVLPGEKALFLASPEKALALVIPERKKGDFYGDYVFRLHEPEKRKNLEKVLKTLEGAVETNTALLPRAYAFGFLDRLFRAKNPLFDPMLAAMRLDPISLYLAGFALFILALGARFWRKAGKAAVHGACVLAGFVSFGLQGLVLFTFSALCGQVYWALGLIAGFFMTGLFAGSLLVYLGPESVKERPYPWLAAAMSALAVLPLVLNLFVYLKVFSAISLSLLALGTGAATGAIFPLLVSQARQAGAGREGASLAGRFYGLDLLGACLAALLVGPLCLVILGVFGTGWFLSLVMVSGLVMTTGQKAVSPAV